jgi:hypothetical protein
MIIASNPTAAIPMIKKANAAGSCSSQYLCTRICPYPMARVPIHYGKVSCSPATLKGKPKKPTFVIHFLTLCGHLLVKVCLRGGCDGLHH